MSRPSPVAARLPAPIHGRRGAALLAVVVTLLWSTSWVLIRWGLDDHDLPPITFAGLRYGAAAAVLGVWAMSGPHRTELRQLARPALRRLVLLGVVMYAVTQGAQFVAISAQPATTTSLLIAMTPLVVALTSAAALSEPTTRAQQVGGVVIVGGAAIYFAGDLGATGVGLAAAIVQLAANAAAGLLGRSVNRTEAVSPLAVTVVSMSVGAVLLLVTGLIVQGLPGLPPSALLIVAWLAVVNTALAFTWWNRVHRRLTAAETAAINSLMVVQIAILGWIFLSEPLGVAEIAGILLVVAGTYTMRAR